MGSLQRVAGVDFLTGGATDPSGRRERERGERRRREGGKEERGERRREGGGVREIVG